MPHSTIREQQIRRVKTRESLGIDRRGIRRPPPSSETFGNGFIISYRTQTPEEQLQRVNRRANKMQQEALERGMNRRGIDEVSDCHQLEDDLREVWE